jgi:hypothetical protein
MKIFEYINKLKKIQLTEVQSYKNRAECLKMCSHEEVIKRTQVELGSISHFESNLAGDTAAELCVKQFSRSAAGSEKQIPSEIRPPIVVAFVVDYLRECIADQDRVPAGKCYYKYQAGQDKHSFMDVYSFMSDRLRQCT